MYPNLAYGVQVTWYRACAKTICTGQALWGSISRKRLEIHTWSQWRTNRKWGMGSRMVTWPMTSRDLKRSRSWPRYRKMQISRKLWEIEVRYQLTTNRKWLVANWMHIWTMTSLDFESSRSWPNYVWGVLSWKRLEIHIHIWSQWSTYRKWLLGYEMVTWPITSRNLKC